MASLWRHWPVRDLVGLLERQDQDLLSSLDTLLPAIIGEGFNTDELYRQDNLIKIVTAFLPSNAFTNVQFRTDCLNRLPPEELRDCAREVGVAVEIAEFSDCRDTIGRHTWSETFARAFIAHFELPDHFIPAESEEFPTELDLQFPFTIHSHFKQLKDYQVRVCEQAAEKLTAPRARFVIQMPTGSGKTRTSMETICQELNADGDPPVVVWLAHSEELCEQSFQCFLDVWPHLGNRPLRAHRCWGSHDLPDLDPNRASFVVAGFQKLHAATTRDQDALSLLRSRCELIVVDEAHRTEAPTYKAVVNELLGDNTRVIGLTATPGRTSIDGTEKLAEFYFNQLIELPDDGGQGVIAMLRDRGVLSHARYIPIITEITIPLTPQQQRHVQERFELPPKVVADLGQNEVRNLEIIKRLVIECKKDHRILLFSCSVDHSQFLTSILIYLGFRAGHIDGTTKSSRRRELITEFKTGAIQVLSNFGVLQEGFDAPNTDVVFITRPTSSPVLYSQMIGRGLRGPEIGGTTNCTVIDVRDNILGFGDADRVFALFEDYWVN